MQYGFDRFGGVVALREKLTYGNISKAVFGKYEGDNDLARMGMEFHKNLGVKLAQGSANFDLETLRQAEFAKEVRLKGDLGNKFVVSARADYVFVSGHKRIAHFIEGKVRAKPEDSDLLQAACDAAAMMGDRIYGNGRFNLGLQFYYGNSGSLVPVDVYGIRNADNALIALGETALAFLKMVEDKGYDGGVPMLRLKEKVDERFLDFKAMASGFFGINAG